MRAFRPLTGILDRVDARFVGAIPGTPSARSSLRAGPPCSLVEGLPQIAGHSAAQRPENEVSAVAAVASINCNVRNGLAR